MARQSLGGMLSSVPTTAETAPESAASDPAASKKQGVSKPSNESVQDRPNRSGEENGGEATASRPSAITSSQTEAPRYLTLQRKEARLTDDQLDALTLLTRRLNKRGRSKDERITDNTLIRVAVDLLLARADDLAGTTEAELRNSVSL